jgi:FkbM family methyltransferase
MPVEWHVMIFGTYEPELRTVLRSVLPAKGTAVDIGANVGWHTLLMAKLVGESGRVIAVEPNPSVRNRLHENVDLNRFKNVSILPCAVGASEQPLDFYGPEADDPDSGNGHVVDHRAGARKANIRVDASTLDAIADAAKIERLDTIKIDVEGYEWPVFCGGANTIAKFRPHILFEFNKEYAVRGGGTQNLIAEFFRDHRYRLFAIGRCWAHRLDGEQWPDCTDIWATPTSA